MVGGREIVHAKPSARGRWTISPHNAGTIKNQQYSLGVMNGSSPRWSEPRNSPMPMTRFHHWRDRNRKELFARALFLLSERSHRQFLSVNCAQYHDGQLIASELFGHRRGAFTGAVADHRGMFEEADGGVVFLDEVGELSPAAQAMLLRVLGEGEIVAVGSTQVKRIDVRVIAATSRDLVSMVGRRVPP